MKKVVVYFSYSGNTAYIAEIIKNQENCDIFEINLETPYSKDFNKLMEVSKKEVDQGCKPPIESIDVSHYDFVYVGTPNWWNTLAPPVSTFLAENDFEGKTIAPFITHGGGGNGTIEEDIHDLDSVCEVLEPFSVVERGDDSLEEDIKNWIGDN